MPMPEIKTLSTMDTAKAGDYFKLPGSEDVFRAISSEGRGCSGCVFRKGALMLPFVCQNAPRCEGVIFKRQAESHLTWFSKREDGIPLHQNKLDVEIADQRSVRTKV